MELQGISMNFLLNNDQELLAFPAFRSYPHAKLRSISLN